MGRRAQAIALVGDYNSWDPKDDHWAVRNDFGVWELFLPDKADGTQAIQHKCAAPWCQARPSSIAHQASPIRMPIEHRETQHVPARLSLSWRSRDVKGFANWFCGFKIWHADVKYIAS